MLKSNRRKMSTYSQQDKNKRRRDESVKIMF